MCASPKDRGEKRTHYKHLHTINGDVMEDGRDHHFSEVAEAAERRKQERAQLERRYKQRHPDKKKRRSWWATLLQFFK